MLYNKIEILRKVSFILIRGYFAPLILLLIVISCSTTKYVPENKHLLKKNVIKVSGDRISAEELQPYIRQRPNRTGLFNIRFFLWQYNLSGKDTSKCLNRKLREWGEPPVILDTFLIQNSITNIKSFLRERGYYYASVHDTVIYKRKKANVIYSVMPNFRYRIKNVSYEIGDSAISSIIQKDSSRNRLNGGFLSATRLESEQKRITSLLRNKGYYNFNKSYVTFEADTSNKENVHITTKIANYSVRIDEQVKIVPHPVFRINHIYIYTNYNSVKAITDSNYLAKFDTLYEKKLYILYDEKLTLKSGVLSRVNLISPGGIYREEDVELTYNNLVNLGLFKSVTINFQHANRINEKNEEYVDCVIRLDPRPQQFYKVDFEISTNTSDLIGFAPGFQYSHRNLIGSAEIFSLNFRGIFQYSYPSAEKFVSSYEHNVVSSIRIPRFLLPINIKYFKTQIPHTQVATSFLYQKRPDYTRSIAGTSFGYIWKTSPQYTFMTNIVDFNMVKMWEISDSFYDRINDTIRQMDPYLRSTYIDHFILGMTGSILYNSKSTNNLLTFSTQRRRSPFYYYRLNMDVAGNLLSTFNGLMKKDEEGSRVILGMPYSQYAKVDFNFVHVAPVFSRGSFATRFFIGLGMPYGNSISLPFERMYFAGGANSMRGWPVRGVGPGSAAQDSTYIIPNQVANFRLELNAEYRFPLFWVFEGGVFADVGNIWSISPKETRPGASFQFNSFYKEIAANTGFGLRLNFNYFILRFDLGMRLFDPARKDYYIPPAYWLSGSNKAFHIGINYPF